MTIQIKYMLLKNGSGSKNQKKKILKTKNQKITKKPVYYLDLLVDVTVSVAVAEEIVAICSNASENQNREK